MDCKNLKAMICPWVDGELRGPKKDLLERHLKECVLCQKEAEHVREFDELLRTPDFYVEVGPDFDASFWNKVREREKEPWILRFWEDLEQLIPTPRLSEAVAVFLVALLIGGAGGFVMTKNALASSVEAKRTSIYYLSGFQEFKGVPTASVAATYLKSIEEKDSA